MSKVMENQTYSGYLHISDLSFCFYKLVKKIRYEMLHDFNNRKIFCLLSRNTLESNKILHQMYHLINFINKITRTHSKYLRPTFKPGVDNSFLNCF